jgi:hypothetical protein
MAFGMLSRVLVSSPSKFRCTITATLELFLDGYWIEVCFLDVSRCFCC